MALGLDRSSVPSIETPTALAPPSEFRQGNHFLLKRVVRRNGHLSGPIDLRHFPQELQAMIRPMLQHIELPLMDHFMSQGVEQFLFRVRRPCGELFKQRERKTNFTMTVSHGEG